MTELGVATRRLVNLGVTARCDLACRWCRHCSRSVTDAPPPDLSCLPHGPITVRLEGGDPVGYADLASLSRAIADRCDATFEVQGPGHHLANAERRAALVDARIEKVRVMTPAIDPGRGAELTGTADFVERTIEGVARLLDQNIAVEAVVPLNRLTVAALDETLVGIAERFEGRVPVTLARAPLRRRRSDAAQQTWDELIPLSATLARLPRELPHRTRLTMDGCAGYAPCLLPAGSFREGLFDPLRTDDERPIEAFLDPATCSGCAWRAQCGAQLLAGDAVPHGAMKALDATCAAQLDGASHARSPVLATSTGTIQPGAKDALTTQISKMLCVAPWTTLTLYQGQHSQPVPCAPSWVDTKMYAEDIARELGRTRLSVFQENGQSRERSGLDYFDLMNDDWPLQEMWNGPLYRLMRREMASGGKSHRCRDSCRVILGVEERGKPFFRVPDQEVTPEVAANRRQLLDEIQSGNTIVAASPLELTVGVSAHCNFTCGFCEGPQGKFGELSPRRYQEVVEWLPGLMQLSVVGPGEPLMSRSFVNLMELVATGRFPSLTVSITSNGTLARPEWLRRHERVRWGMIRFSINAGSAETHERMTGKKLFDRLIENVETVVELRARANPSFSFVLSCVLSKLVLGDLQNYAELVDKFGALPVLEPMTGDMNGLSPYRTEEDTRRVMEECSAVARAFEERNPAIVSAFRAMERFARDRLERGDFRRLPMM